MSEDKHFRRALVPGLVISALLIGVGFWQSITMGIVCLVGCGALLAIFCLYTRNQIREIRRLPACSPSSTPPACASASCWN